jgi:hypothetical protein
MPISSMGILILHSVTCERKKWAGKPVGRKLRHRPRQRSGIGMLVRVVTRPHQRS